MRRRPVTRSEIRFDGEQITTLPADAVRVDSDGELVPIEELFAALLRWLEYEQAVQSREDSPSLAALETWEPIRCPWPYYRYGGPRGQHTCRLCGRDFYRSIAGRHQRTTYCSDTCAEASSREVRAFHNAATIKARSEAAAVARAGRRCAYCDKPLMAQRSTKKFCGARCRINAHRAKYGRPPAAVARARCAYCDKPLTAQRSTKKFCDVTCRRNAHWAKAAVARAGRHCAYCDKPLTAQRSTKKFCDDTCRRNAHRAAKDGRPGRGGEIAALARR